MHAARVVRARWWRSGGCGGGGGGGSREVARVSQSAVGYRVYREYIASYRVAIGMVTIVTTDQIV